MDLSSFTASSHVRFERLSMLAHRIESALHNALVGAECFYHPDPDCPERSDDDDGYPGDSIVSWYRAYIKQFEASLTCAIPDPLPAYVVDISTACRTGDGVPWTGVWYPSTGMKGYSLTFAIKGGRMQPAFRIKKTEEELESEGIWGGPETVAVATTWYPVISSVTRDVVKDLGGRNMKGIIRLGDTTSHGGKVVAASGMARVHGITVARQGDACICPIKGHTPCVIADGDPHVLLGGVPVAFEGHKTSCGATLISSAPTSGKV